MPNESTPASGLRPVDRLEVISLIDNIVDLQSEVSAGVLRFWQWVPQPRRAAVPWAEHGFAALVRVYEGDTAHTILFDTGAGPMTAVLNARRLLIELSTVEAIAISHGHPDHFGGLLGVLQAIGQPAVPVFVHEHAFRVRGSRQPDGTVQREPPLPDATALGQAGGVVHLVKWPLLLADNLVLLTGEIPRHTDFEPGRPNQMFLAGNDWQPDPLLLDDQALIVHVRGMGLVVVTGCAHAGIINTARYAQKLIPTAPVNVLIGGFHLIGPQAAWRVERTAIELAALGLGRVVPSHCTGSLGSRTIAAALPDAFVPASVGNLYRFPAENQL